MKRILLLSCAVFICCQLSKAQQKEGLHKYAPHVSMQDQNSRLARAPIPP